MSEAVHRSRHWRSTEKPQDEAVLMERIGGGDVDAFRTLYRLYYPRLFGYLQRMTHRSELVEEVLDDAMMVVWRKADRFRSQSRVSTWIFGIAYRQALTALRRSRRRREAERQIEPPEAGTGATPESELSERQQADRLRRALGRLSPKQRAVVELTYDHGLSYPEIAEIVGCPVGTVKTRMFHARRKLRDLLPELPDGPRAGRRR